MKITTVGIDLAKDIFRVHSCDARGRELAHPVHRLMSGPTPGSLVRRWQCSC
jgi:hypothetical protein